MTYDFCLSTMDWDSTIIAKNLTSSCATSFHSGQKSTLFDIVFDIWLRIKNLIFRRITIPSNRREIHFHVNCRFHHYQFVNKTKRNRQWWNRQTFISAKLMNSSSVVFDCETSCILYTVYMQVRIRLGLILTRSYNRSVRTPG